MITHILAAVVWAVALFWASVFGFALAGDYSDGLLWTAILYTLLTAVAAFTLQVLA